VTFACSSAVALTESDCQQPERSEFVDRQAQHATDSVLPPSCHVIPPDFGKVDPAELLPKR